MHKDHSISWLWKPIITSKQAQKKQQKMQNMQCDLHTVQTMHYPLIVILPMLFEMALPLHIFPWKSSLDMDGLYQLSLRSTRFQLL